MPFITTPERIGIEKGLLRAIKTGLEVRFGDPGLALMEQIEFLYDAEILAALHKSILLADTLDEVRRACKKATTPMSPPKKKTRRKT